MGTDYATSLTGVQFNVGKFPPAAALRGAEQGGDIDGGKRVSSGQKSGDDLFQAVNQTLSQLGLGLPGKIAVNPADAILRSETVNANPGSTGEAGQALNQFMHALFQALGPNSDNAPIAKAATGAESAGASAQGFKAAGSYANLTTRLDGVIQNLSGNAAIADTSIASANSNLTISYQNLVEALAQGAKGDSSSGSGSQTGLLTFLQGLEQRLQSTDNNTSAGNLIRTTA